MKYYAMWISMLLQGERFSTRNKTFHLNKIHVFLSHKNFQRITLKNEIYSTRYFLSRGIRVPHFNCNRNLNSSIECAHIWSRDHELWFLSLFHQQLNPRKITMHFREPLRSWLNTFRLNNNNCNRNYSVTMIDLLEMFIVKC